MKKLLIITMIASMMVMGGCGKDQPEPTNVDNSAEGRFILTGQEFDINGSAKDIVILEDTQTHILYLYTTGHGGGITPWLDADGKPMKAGE